MRLDIHSIIHFVGSYALAMTFFVWGVPQYWGWAMVLGFLWEIFDHLNYWYELNIPFLDPRGADWVDVIVDYLGIALAVVVLSL